MISHKFTLSLTAHKGNFKGKLNAYLADVDKQAEKRFERLVEQMKQAQGITERLRMDGKNE